MAWQFLLVVVERTNDDMNDPGDTLTTTKTIPLVSSVRPTAMMMKDYPQVKTIMATFRDEITYPYYSASLLVQEV